jgi:hypothetical protein
MQPGKGKIQVANTRNDRAGGQSAGPRRGPQPKMHARERIAAERAARERAEARRRLLVAIASVTTVPVTVLTRVGPGQAITPLQTVKTSGPPLTVGGKPAIVFVSEESCPFCIDTFDVPPLRQQRRPVRGRFRSSISPTGASWRARSTTRRYSPACLRLRSPASSATPPARWPGPSTGQPRSSSRPSSRSCTTRRPTPSQMGSPSRRRPTSMLPRVALE